MFRFYRELERNEFIVVGGDCAQGGEDKNVWQFLSKTKIDVPIVFERQGVASAMTPFLLQALEGICHTTGVKPVVALERQMGGSSEMERLKALNRNNMFDLFVMPVVGRNTEEEIEGTQLGYNMNSAFRPTAIGDLKNIIDINGIGIYDSETIKQLFWFIIGKNGKPEAMKGKHDDHVMSLAIAWQLYQLCNKPMTVTDQIKIVNSFPKDDRFKKGFY